MNNAKPEILLGVTGSIAAYKAAELLRAMVRSEWIVHVIMTEAATRFIAPLTFRTLSRNPVATGLFDTPETWMPGHVSLADRADLMAIAPCTANVAAKLTVGLADDALTATALACRAPLLLAPAMNDGMWEHPATRANLGRLRERGVTIVEPATGDLACDRVGAGRLAPVEEIFAAIRAKLGGEHSAQS